MSPPEARRAPADDRSADVVRHGGRADVWTVPQSIRDRRDAALRLAPYTDLWGLPGRDPWASEHDPAPSSFGLRRHEMLAEVERRKTEGWAPWELLNRFVNPATVAA